MGAFAGLRVSPDRLTLSIMKTAAQFSVSFAAAPLLSGCAWIFGPNLPEKVSGDTNGIVIKNGSNTDQREMAASHCGSFNKSSLLQTPEATDRRNDIVRFACR